jgi:unspecific monooxygenase
MPKQINEIDTIPFLQQVQWVADPVSYMETSAQKFPDIFTAKFIGFGNSLVLINEPQAIQQVLTNDRKQFSAPGELNEIPDFF